MKSATNLNMEIRWAQVRQLFDQSSEAFIWNALLAAGVAIGLTQAPNWRVLAPWLLAIFLAGYAWMNLVKAFERYGRVEKHIDCWGQYHALAVALTGACWGVGCWFFWPMLPCPEHMIIPSGILALSIVSVLAYCPDKPSFILFTITALAPVNFRLISEDNMTHFAFGVLGFFFLLFLIRMGIKGHINNANSYKALKESQLLATALSEEKIISDSLNSRLRAEIKNRKKEQSQLTRIKDDWERTFDAVPDLITILDKEHRIIRANKSTLEKLAVNPEELHFERCFKFFHDSDKPPENCPHVKLLQDGGAHTVEITEDILGGVYNVSVSPLYNGKMDLIGSVHVARDITERKKTETELERIGQNLERIVKDRTEDLMEANIKLEQEVRQRQTAEKTIMASLNEKEILLQEIHHRVKNNLQIISSLIGLQETNIVDQKVLEALRDSKNRIKSMSLIHELLYKSSDLGKIEVARYLEQLTKDLFRTYTDFLGKVEFQVNAEPMFLGLDTAVPCGLIVNELVSNCLKHAFIGRSSGFIEVGFHQLEDSTFELSVSDNGIGIPAGVSLESQNSLGLRLVRELAVSQLKGNLDMSNSSGATVKIFFKERISPVGRAK